MYFSSQHNILSYYPSSQKFMSDLSFLLPTPSVMQSILKKDCQLKYMWSEQWGMFFFHLEWSSYSARGMLQRERKRMPQNQWIPSQCSMERQLIKPNYCSYHKSHCLSKAFLLNILQYFLIIQGQEFPMKHHF